MFEQKKITYKMKLLSSLAKVFQDEEPVYHMECQTLMLFGEKQYLFRWHIPVIFYAESWMWT